jgi:hypothetical protein
MTKRPIKDVAASIRQRLFDNAKQTGRPFQEILQYYAMERFLYRLAQSPHADKFVLKGALMFTTWRAPSSRPTKDIDFLVRINNSVDAILTVVRDICLFQVEPDGLVFDTNSLEGMVIKEDADYEGVRVTFFARLQKAEVRMQIDLGFGDVLTPAATLAEYPTILDLAPPILWGYSRETVIAEKFEAMVKLGQLNSRMKDFFDIWLLARQFNFDGAILAEAIAKTFLHRGTAMVVPPLALTTEFVSDPAKVDQWRAFLRKSRITSAPEELSQVIDALADFLMPVARTIHEGHQFVAQWIAPGPWTLHRE